MSKIKKVLALFVCIALVIGVLPGITVFAAIEEGTCGTNLKWTFNTVTGVLTISGTGKMSDFSYSAPWHSYRNNITSVIIENGVTSIGKYAFKSCGYTVE